MERLKNKSLENNRNLQLSELFKSQDYEYKTKLEQKVLEERLIGKRLLDENKEQNKQRLQKQALEKESDKKWIKELLEKEKNLISLEKAHQVNF